MKTAFLTDLKNYVSSVHLIESTCNDALYKDAKPSCPVMSLFRSKRNCELDIRISALCFYCQGISSVLGALLYPATSNVQP